MANTHIDHHLTLLQHLRTTGGTLDTLTRLVCGGSACPAMLRKSSIS